jgi:hypothetical protein
MLLREFIYFDKNQADMRDDGRYSPQNNKTLWSKSHTRDIKLTLGMLNDMRRAGEAHEKEMREEHGLVRKMYALPAPEQGQLPAV